MMPPGSAVKSCGSSTPEISGSGCVCVPYSGGAREGGGEGGGGEGGSGEGGDGEGSGGEGGGEGGGKLYRSAVRGWLTCATSDGR